MRETVAFALNKLKTVLEYVGFCFLAVYTVFPNTALMNVSPLLAIAAFVVGGLILLASRDLCFYWVAPGARTEFVSDYVTVRTGVMHATKTESGFTVWVPGTKRVHKDDVTEDDKVVQ